MSSELTAGCSNAFFRYLLSVLLYYEARTSFFSFSLFFLYGFHSGSWAFVFQFIIAMAAVFLAEIHIYVEGHGGPFLLASGSL